MVVVEKDDAGRSLKAWVSMEFPQLAVSPKQKIKLDFSIAIPENAEPGTYLGNAGGAHSAKRGGRGVGD